MIAAIGIVVLGTVDAGDPDVGLVLPGIATFGLGMAITVAPLTAAVLAAVTTSLGGLTAAVFVGQTARVRPTANPAVQQPCCDPAVLTERRAA